MLTTTLIDILNSNGIQDAIWSLRCFKYNDYRMFLADIAAYAIADAAADAAHATAYAADAAADAARENKWNEIENIFIKHFGA